MATDLNDFLDRPIGFVAAFKANFKEAFTHISTYVIFFYTSAAGWWLLQDTATQQAILNSWPPLRWILPAASFVAFMVAKGWPQGDDGK